MRDAREPLRPVAAALRRHTSRACWAFRLEFTDGAGEIAWEAVLGITGDVHGHVLDPAGIRRLVGAVNPVLLPLVGEAHRTLLHEFVRQIRPLVDVATARESAIITAIGERHSRLAASLLQPTLFDRRAERESAAQRGLLADTLSRCHAHLAYLHHLGAAGPGEMSPVFVVLR